MATELILVVASTTEATAENALLDLNLDRVRYYSCRHSTNVPAMSLGILGAREWWHGGKFSMPLSSPAGGWVTPR